MTVLVSKVYNYHVLIVSSFFVLLSLQDSKEFPILLLHSIQLIIPSGKYKVASCKKRILPWKANLQSKKAIPMEQYVTTPE